MEPTRYADDVRVVAEQLAEALEGLMHGVTGIYHPQSRLGKAVTALHVWRQFDGDQRG